MAVVRILVDGYSMLHGCPEIAPGKPRFSAAARDELVAELTRFQDANAVPVTVIFDGGQTPGANPDPISTPEMEVLYSRGGRTADDLIERAAFRLTAFGDVLVVTDDLAERETVRAFGALAIGCASFLNQIQSARTEFECELNRLNARERRGFRNSGR